MATYAGETLLIVNSMTLDGATLTDADVDSVQITIYDALNEVVVDQTLMSWNATDERFEYKWDTSPGGSTPYALEPGNYRAKVMIYGLNGEENWEYLKIKLSKNPVD